MRRMERNDYQLLNERPAEAAADRRPTDRRATESRPVKMWTEGVPVEPEAKEQLARLAQLPFVFRHIAVMPDVHVGKGSTIGSVIPTLGAVIPAAVGVDIGCSSDIHL